MDAPRRSWVPDKPFHVEALAPGVTWRRLYPGGMLGPDAITRNDIPGGQTWSESYILGREGEGPMMVVPDIRMPPNQIWPMHWHDCWTVVVVLEGKCLIGDWYMDVGDVFVSAPSIEYGPLLNGTMGCRLLEIFGDGALAPGGYGPELHDHPTLQGGTHVFKTREGPNRQNDGHSRVSMNTPRDGIWKTRLEPGWKWDLGDPGDPERAVISDGRMPSGEAVAARKRGDWYAALILDGSIEVAGRTLVRDDVLLVEPGGEQPAIKAGPSGVQMIEHFRTTRAL